MLFVNIKCNGNFAIQVENGSRERTEERKGRKGHIHNLHLIFMISLHFSAKISIKVTQNACHLYFYGIPARNHLQQILVYFSIIHSHELKAKIHQTVVFLTSFKRRNFIRNVSRDQRIDQSATSIQSLLNTNGATFLMTSHVRSALWTLP